MSTRTSRLVGPSRHRRAWRPWRWAPGVLAGCDEELGVIADHERVVAWTRTLTPAPEVKILPGAEHFLHGRLTELRGLVGAWLAARAAESG